MKRKFWNWVRDSDSEARTLVMNGIIAEESWFGDEVTPAAFRDELFQGNGDITVWINSPGGDVVAAAQIYNMLLDYKGRVTVRIDGIAASAASVVAMAGDEVLMSPVSMMLIHNPATIVSGDHQEMAKAIGMLDEVKESIINAYEKKTHMARAELSALMDAETWMNANKAVELGFADRIAERTEAGQNIPAAEAQLFSGREVSNALVNKLAAVCCVREEAAADPAINTPEASEAPQGRNVCMLMERLEIIKNHI